jgi:hypothetical protein
VFFGCKERSFVGIVYVGGVGRGKECRVVGFLSSSSSLLPNSSLSSSLALRSFFSSSWWLHRIQRVIAAVGCESHQGGSSINVDRVGSGVVGCERLNMTRAAMVRVTILRTKQ